ncbi:MAG: SUMF1/EgtB/PvdO family nonheme iron enzyme [Bacteroidales bacterium]|nr:SUMF1/EgtB/PvdO family nonheme iron enzyme [Bacteroidales bacterium]
MNNVIRFLILAAMMAVCGTVMAQDDCFNPTMEEARKQEAKGNYDRALQLYKEAQGCFDSFEKGKAAAKNAEAECRKKKEEAARNGESQGQQQEISGTVFNSTIQMDGNDIVWTENNTKYRMKMILVEGGTFEMGRSGQKINKSDNERPAHSVSLTNYYIGETEVTQALWKAVMGKEPMTKNGGWEDSYGIGPTYPAYRINYNDVKTFVKKLSKKTGRTFRMPTEAEWEYAARGGKYSKGYEYSGSANYKDVVIDEYGSTKIFPVKTKKANELGLYDMCGNLWEWCSDWYGLYSNSAQTNPKGPSSGSKRVARGGSWAIYRPACTVWHRWMYAPSEGGADMGFRLALEP